MTTVRLTTAQAVTRYLCALSIADDDAHNSTTVPFVNGVWAIFGHGNVAGLGEALWQTKDRLPVLRAHNEQAMAHSAIAYAKSHFRRRIMAVTTSIGPGATNLVTAAALAHVNRIPVLFLPGDVFSSRMPDPVLQQLESNESGDISVNDCLRPVSRYFDRITRPEQLLNALPRAISVLTDPAQCGPVTLALPQDVQCMAYDFPVSFFTPRVLCIARPQADQAQLQDAVSVIKTAKKPIIISGGGVLYSHAGATLAQWASDFGVGVTETQAGKSSLSWQHPYNLGAIGVTGSPYANQSVQEADLIIALGTRLQDFTTGSNILFGGKKIISINVQMMDAFKQNAFPVVADVQVSLNAIHQSLREANWQADRAWQTLIKNNAQQWRDQVNQITQDPKITNPKTQDLPYDAHVIGAVRDSKTDKAIRDIVVCAAGTLPAELHKLWRADHAGDYHVEYGYSCMGYEIAAGVGIKYAHPEATVIVMVGDGSYLMMNSEIATSVMLGLPILIVVQDNRGYGCINRLQDATGSANYNNLLTHCVPEKGVDVMIDFVAHARSLGAYAEKISNIAHMKTAMVAARQRGVTSVLVIDTTPHQTTETGGAWWEVAIPEVSTRVKVNQARQNYETQLQKRAQ